MSEYICPVFKMSEIVFLLKVWILLTVWTIILMDPSAIYTHFLYPPPPLNAANVRVFKGGEL